MNTPTFSDSELLRKGWRIFKENAGFYIGAMILAAIVLIALFFLPTAIVEYTRPDLLPEEIAMLILLASMLLYVFAGIVFGLGFMKASIALVDGQKLKIGYLFQHWSRFFPYIAVWIVYGVVVAAGALLFFIPGVIFAMMFMFAPYLVIDKGLNPIEAMKESAALTAGRKWDLLAFGYLLTIVSYLGFAVFIVGAFVSFPVMLSASAALYRTFVPAGSAQKQRTEHQVSPQTPQTA